MKRQYYLYLGLAIIMILAMPYLQYTPYFLYSDTAGYVSENIFVNKKTLIFLIIGILCIVLSYTTFRKMGFMKDSTKKLEVLNPNIKKIIFSVFIIIMISLSLTYFSDRILTILGYDQAGHTSYKDLFLLGIATTTYSLFTMLIIAQFAFAYYGIKRKIDKGKLRYSHIYWGHFIKSILLFKPTYAIGAVMLIMLTCTIFIIRGGNDELIRKHFIYGLSFYSFWMTSFIATAAPFIESLSNLNTTYQNYSFHIINNSIIPNYNQHVLVIGTGTLGNQILKNCFCDIHPEGYGVTSLRLDNDVMWREKVKNFSDYDIIIDRDFTASLISRRIIVVEKQEKFFKTIFKDPSDQKIGILYPWEKNPSLGILGIVGDAINPVVLNGANAEKAQIIVNATPVSKLSLELEIDFPKVKQILTVIDAPSYDIITSTAYDKALYTIDAYLVESIPISQRIIHWANKNVMYNLRNKYQSEANFPEFLGRIQNEFIKDYKLENYPEKNSSSLLAATLLSRGKGKVLITGFSNMVFCVIQTMWLTLKFELKLPDKIINEIINSKITVFTNNDSFIENEIKNGYWNFYPVRNRNTTKENHLAKIKTFTGGTNNFEKYVEVIDEVKPELVVLIAERKFESVEMFIRASDAIEMLQNTNTYDKKKGMDIPQFIIYTHKEDLLYLREQVKKYFTFNLERKERAGYPTHRTSDSRVAKDYVSSNQYSSILRALYQESTKQKDKYSEHVAELTISVDERPGALAYVVSWLNGKTIEIDKENINCKIPSFTYYHSFAEKRYKDTFVFTATAKLQQRRVTEKIEDVINYCLLNCEENHRANFEQLIKNNLEFVSQRYTVDELYSRPNDQGMFSNYPISTMLRHRNTHSKILNDKTRLFSFQESGDNAGSEENVDLNNPENVFSLFNLADFSLWAEGEDSPCTFASTLSSLILGRLKLKDKCDTEISPLITFSINRPSNEILSDGNTETKMVVQDSFYIKLCEKPRNDIPDKPLIRGLKIKQTSAFEIEPFGKQRRLKNNEWLGYVNKLFEFLNKEGHAYSMYVVEKIYIEGTEYQSTYKGIELSIFNEIENNYWFYPAFKVVTYKTKDHNPNNITFDYPENDAPRFETCRRDDCYTFGKLSVDTYEVVLIRNNIVREAVYEKDNEQEDSTYRNMVYFINSL